MRRDPSSGVLEAAGLLLLLGAFFCFQLTDLYTPGLNVEGYLREHEQARQLLAMLRERSLWDIGRSGALPTAGNPPYHGVLMAYVFLPFIALFGPNWTVARLMPIFIASGIVLAAYAFMRILFGRGAALLAAALLVFHPTFLLGARIGNYLVIAGSLVMMASLACLARAWVRRDFRYMAAAAFFAGLGLFTHLWFVWYITALAAAGAAFHRAFYARFRISGLAGLGRLALWTVPPFAVGASLVVYREIVQRAWTVAVVFRGLWRGWPESGYLHRLDQFNDLLTGEGLHWVVFSEPPRIADPLWPWLFWAAAAVLGAAGFRGARRPLFLIVLLAAMLLQSPFTPTRATTEHPMFFLFTLAPLIVAAAAADLWRRSQRAARAGLVVCGLAVAGLDAACARSQLALLHTAGGAGLFSDAIYEMADWFAVGNARGRPLFYSARVVDHEFVRHFDLIIPRTPLEYVPVSGRTPAKIAEDLVRRYRERSTEEALYVRFLTDRIEDILLEKEMPKRGFRAERLRDFRDGRDDPVFTVYSLKAARR